MLRDRDPYWTGRGGGQPCCHGARPRHSPQLGEGSALAWVTAILSGLSGLTGDTAPQPHHVSGHCALLSDSTDLL